MSRDSALLPSDFPTIGAYTYGMLTADAMLAHLADSRLPDDEYAAMCSALRRMFARCSAADRLAGAVLAAESYQPESVMAALGAFVSAGSDPVAA